MDKFMGHDAYEPIMGDAEMYYIGLPLFIIDEGGKCRMSTPDEALASIPIDE